MNGHIGASTLKHARRILFRDSGCRFFLPDPDQRRMEIKKLLTAKRYKWLAKREDGRCFVRLCLSLVRMFPNGIPKNMKTPKTQKETT